MEFSCRIDALRASFTKSRRSAIGRCRPFGLPDWGPFGVVSNRSLAATRPSFSIVHFTASVEMLSTFGVETPIGNHASRRDHQACGSLPVARGISPARIRHRRWFGVLRTVTTDLYPRTAGYIDRIFKGAKPADLPVEEPTTYEFVLNLKAAATLGLRIPQSTLVRADRLIR